MGKARPRPFMASLGRGDPVIRSSTLSYCRKQKQASLLEVARALGLLTSWRAESEDTVGNWTIIFADKDKI